MPSKKTPRLQAQICWAWQPSLRGLFYPDLALPCVQDKHLIYRWDGEHIA